MLDTLRRIVQEVNNAADIPSALNLMASGSAMPWAPKCAPFICVTKKSSVMS